MAAHDGAFSSSFSGSSMYDVFLSFRGEETRNNFTGFLYRALRRERINVFMDNEDLCVGEEIRPALLEAIRRSKISIPVFSKGYADSRWCLMELDEIVRCHRCNGQIIMPIFFNVEPTNVRHQSGSFEESFQKHKERYDAHTVKSWKEALILVGGIRGYNLTQLKGNQPELVDLVVDWVLGESSNNHLGDVKNPIGLDERAQDLLYLLNSCFEGVPIVGICGIGGIGKTTIAMTLYNRIFKSFRRSGFLVNIREKASAPNGLVFLQEQLIYSVSKKKVDGTISDIYSGKELIKERLQGENVLLILDGVDSHSQLDALAIEFNWFGPESKIIITTRDEHILDLAKVDEDKRYWPNELDDEQSLQLFSLHAFSSDRPPDDYRQLSYDVLRLAGGLPLTLEVLGSYFFDIRDKEVWKRGLRRLERIPNKEVLKILKISYDDLEDEEKSIFLDAACFFVGWRKETVISLWEACGFDSISAIRRLTQRSLLKFTKIESYAATGTMSNCYDELMMHDQIQAMGRGIVLRESPIEPGERSRLYIGEEILDVLQENKGTRKIEGILSPFHKLLSGVCLHKDYFSMMPKLRFLNIDGAHSIGDFSHLPSSLTLFSWEECPLKILPANFYHKKLVHMDLSNSSIRQAWTNKPQNRNQRFQKLKFLYLHQCDHLFESPNFSWFPNLETLDLGWCKKMVNLHISIGDLKSLVELDLNGTKIEELPNSICGLISLKRLNLGMCKSLNKLPGSIGDLESLVELFLYGTKIEKLPNSICRLSSLQRLNLDMCVSLNKLPESIGDLKSLVELSLALTKIEKLPNSTCRLSSLQSLNLNMCKSLNKLPKSIGDLNSLVELILNRTKIEELPDGVQLLEKLEVLRVKYCSMLVSLPISWGRMRCLRIINLIGTNILISVDDSLMLPSLVELKIGNELESTLPPWISDLSQLQKLVLHGYTWLESLPELPPTLIYLHVKSCPSLQKIPDLSNLKKLSEIILHDCEELEEIRGLKGTESLEVLYVSSCEALTDTPRKIQGQGTLLVDQFSRSDSLNFDDGVYLGLRLILCVVFAFNLKEQTVQGNVQGVRTYLKASICREDRRTLFAINMEIKNIEFTTEGDIIYIHHFKGFDWFGFPLEGTDAIEEICIVAEGLINPIKSIDCEVKFWKLLLGNMPSGDLQMPNQESCARMVEDFFSWAYDDAGRSRFGPEEVESRQMDVIEQRVYLSCSVMSWETFDPARNRWKRLPRMPCNEFFMYSDKESLVAGTDLLVFGQDITDYVIWMYSLLNHRWSKCPSMNLPRCLFGSSSYGEIAIVAGGMDKNGRILKSAELYNSKLGAWESLSDMNLSRKRCAGFFMDGKFYVIGGISSQYELLTCGEEYNMETRAWKRINDMIPVWDEPVQQRIRPSPLVAVVNNQLYAADITTSMVKKYDKINNTWDIVKWLPVRADFATGCGLAFKACGEKLLVVGGHKGTDGEVIMLHSWHPEDGNGVGSEWDVFSIIERGSVFVYNCAVRNW
ncbi:hypothetical protein NE237_032512 [Protea cynaroides]|uniref:TIR domain-containing protein n=1 Tax=Protea cynaroides TaxID=273540 RepID=A0A9Q0R3M1_9MAGN|nr:hypothetical protein NE237_032512 [Protea cynaroides]